MILDPILPEIYTFIDFAKHGCFSEKKIGNNTYTAHLGGDVPKIHPMPYNVYSRIREYLFEKPEAVEATVAYLENEFKKGTYDFKSISVTSSTCIIKKSFGRSREFPQIDVTLSW